MNFQMELPFIRRQNSIKIKELELGFLQKKYSATEIKELNQDLKVLI
jgi:hypothetical protein